MRRKQFQAKGWGIVALVICCLFNATSSFGQDVWKDTYKSLKQHEQAQMQSPSPPTPLPGLPGRGETVSAQLSEVFTNEDLRPDAPFVLMVLVGGGLDDQRVVNMLQRPQTPEMQRWLQSAELQILDAHSDRVREQHDWLIQKHRGQLPIVALIQMSGQTGKGSTWFDSGAPPNELALATALSERYQQTIAAARQQNARPAMNSMGPVPKSQYLAGPDRKPFFPRDREPLINPTIDISVPDSIDSNVEASLSSPSQRTLLVVGIILAVGFVVGCFLLFLGLTMGLLGGAAMRGFAQTDAPNTKVTRRVVTPVSTPAPRT